MKLKKVTALLLATSMVLTSVNVAPIFADEYIEEADFGTTEGASAEVDLSDDFGVTEDASDEGTTATEEESFFDEEITDEVVEDEEPVADQVVTDEVAYEENADIYEALEQAEVAGEDVSYAADFNMTVTGEAFMEYGYEGELTPYVRKSNSGDSCTNIAGDSFSVAEVSASENCLIITVNGSDEALEKFHFTNNVDTRTAISNVLVSIENKDKDASDTPYAASVFLDGTKAGILESDSKTFEFTAGASGPLTIKPIDISGAAVTLAEGKDSFVYNGEEQGPEEADVIVKLGDETLVKDTAYTVDTITKQTDASDTEYSVSVTGITPNYSGAATTATGDGWKIVPAQLTVTPALADIDAETPSAITSAPYGTNVGIICTVSGFYGTDAEKAAMEEAIADAIDDDAVISSDGLYDIFGLPRDTLEIGTYKIAFDSLADIAAATAAHDKDSNYTAVLAVTAPLSLKITPKEVAVEWKVEKKVGSTTTDVTADVEDGKYTATYDPDTTYTITATAGAAVLKEADWIWDGSATTGETFTAELDDTVEANKDYSLTNSTLALVIDQAPLAATWTYKKSGASDPTVATSASAEVEFNKDGYDVAVTSKEGVDLGIEENTNPVEGTSGGVFTAVPVDDNYKVIENATFTLEMKTAEVEIEWDDEYYYAIGDDAPVPTVTLNGEKLVKGTDYTVEYFDDDENPIENPMAQVGYYNAEVVLEDKYTTEDQTVKGFRVQDPEQAKVLSVVWDANDTLEYKDGQDAYKYPGVTKVTYTDEEGHTEEFYDYYVEDNEVSAKEIGDVRGKHTARIVLEVGGFNYYIPENERTHDWYILDDISDKTAIYDKKAHGLKTYSDVMYYKTVDPEWDAPQLDVDDPTKYPQYWAYESPTKVDAGKYTICYKRVKKNKDGTASWTDTRDAILIINPFEVEAVLKQPITMEQGTGIHATKSGSTTTYDDVLKLADFQDMTLVSGDTAAKVLETKVNWDAATYYKKNGITWTEIPAGTWPSDLSAGTYRVVFDNAVNAVVGNVSGENYAVRVKEDTTGILTVTKKQIKVKWTTKTNLFYNGLPQSVSVESATLDGEDVTSKYTFVYTGNTATDVGSYTATIVGIYEGDKPVTDLTVSNPTCNWKINQRKVYLVVDPDETAVAYGSAEPDSVFDIDDIKVYDLTDKYREVELSKNGLVVGDLKFVTNYRQYDPVYNYVAKDKVFKRAQYDVELVSGITSTNYSIEGAIKGKFVVSPARVTITPSTIVTPYGKEATELTYTLSDTVTGTGEAAALQHDIDAKALTVLLSTDNSDYRTYNYSIAEVDGDWWNIGTVWNVPNVKAAPPTEIDSYPIYSGIDEVVANSGAILNFDITQGRGTYTITNGDFTIKFSDTKVQYDGKSYGITMDPDDAHLPDSVTVYFSTDEYIAYMSEEDAKWYLQDRGTKKSPTFNKVGVYTVYYYVKGPNFKLDLFGSNKVTIMSTDEAKADAVEALIDEAYKKDASGKFDADKVKAASEAYDALTAAEKKLVDVVKVKRLEEEEAQVAADADKAILAALPTSDPLTDADRAAVDAAQKIFDDLTKREQALIPQTTKDKLAAAEKAVAADEAAKAKVAADAIEALPEAKDVTLDDKAKIENARKLYDALNAKEKALVPQEDVDKLAADEAVIKALEEAEGDADKKAAEAVTAMINALPAPEDVTVADENAIENAVKALDALTDAQEALVPDVAKDKLAADVLALVAAKAKEAEDQAAADAIEALIDAIAKSEPGDGKAAMEAAKDAFNNATADVQAKVDKGHQEVLASAVKYYTKDTTFEAGKGVYRVLSNGDVTYVKPLYPEDTYFQVPNDVVCRDGFPFKVVKVSVNAFKGCTNVTKIWMGKNIVTIGKYAFKGATNLRTLIVRTQAIDVTEKIENAFAGMAANRNGKVNVQIWEKMLSKYEPMFRGAGKLPAKAYFTTIG